MAYDIRNIIDISNVIENVPVGARTFGKGLILTTGDSTAVSRVRTYATLSAVLEDFGSNTTVYKMATSYFANGYYGTPEYLYIGIYDSAEDASLEEALVAISATQEDFYTFLADDNFDDTARESIASWIESTDVAYTALFDDSNADTIDTAIDTDLASILQANSYLRSGVVYESADKSGGLDYPACAISGQMSTVEFTTGKSAITFTNKILSGIVGEDLSVYTFLTQKNCGTYTQIKAKGKSATANIVLADGKSLDVVQSTDYMKETLENALLTLVLNSGKIPFTQKGIDRVQGVITEQCNSFKDSGIIGGAIDYQTGILLVNGYEITMPTISDITSTDKANRELNGVKIRLLLAGAIEAIEITNYIQL